MSIYEIDIKDLGNGSWSNGPDTGAETPEIKGYIPSGGMPRSTDYVVPRLEEHNFDIPNANGQNQAPPPPAPTIEELNKIWKKSADPVAKRAAPVRASQLKM